MSKSGTALMTVLAGFFLLAGLQNAWGHNAFVVTDPKQLQLIDLKESYLAINEGLSERPDILSPIRNLAIRKMFENWGIPRPTHGDLSMGTIVEVEEGTRMSFVVVLKGDVKGFCTVKNLTQKYRNHMERNKQPIKIDDIDLNGWKGVRMAYIERDGFWTLLAKDDYLLLCSTGKGDTNLADRTLEVIDSGKVGTATPPQQVNISYHGVVTPREKKKATQFLNRTLTATVRKFRKGFRRLYTRIDGDVDEESLKTTNELINDVSRKMTDFDVKLNYEQGPTKDDDLYHVVYVMNLPGEKEAQTLKELLLEKALYYRQNHPEKGIETTLDSIRIDRQGSKLIVEGEIDTKKKQHDFAFAYTAFLMSYARADTYLGLKSW